MQETVKTLNGTVQTEDMTKLFKEIKVTEPEKGTFTRERLAIAAVAAGILSLIGAYLVYNGGWVTTDDAFIEGHVVAISPRVAGHVSRVFVDDNQQVDKGDVLAEIDPRDYQTKVEDARAELAGARATQRKTALDVRRYEALSAKREASRQTLDHAVADAQSARAAVEAAQARARQAELNLSYTRITAPQLGRVTRKAMEEGAYVAVGQPLLAIVPSEVWVVANFKETQLRKVRPGQPAEISVDAYPGKLKGHVDSLQAGTGARFSLLPPENATGNFVKVVQRMPIKIVLDDAAAKGLLAPGMSVEASIQVK